MILICLYLFFIDEIIYKLKFKLLGIALFDCFPNLTEDAP